MIKPPKTNSGAVIIVTMVMMLLISTIGISSMRSAKLETLMARNMQQKQSSFNNAESSSIVAETEWDDTMVSCLLDIPACDDAVLGGLTPGQMSSTDGVPDMHLIDWGAATNAVSGSYTYGQYVVEYLGFREIPWDADRIIYIYRLTSRGTDSSGISTTLVQTIYRRCMKIDGAPCA